LQFDITEEWLQDKTAASFMRTLEQYANKHFYGYWNLYGSINSTVFH
jgi:hypothetical protein